jgi:hypothetical protein
MLMKLRHTPAALLVLALASCASPPPVQVHQTPSAPDPQQARSMVHMSEAAPAGAPTAGDEAFLLQAAGPVVLKNATATGTNTGSAAANAIDGNVGTKWAFARNLRTATLTVEIDRPAALPVLSVTLNSDSFGAGNTFDVQTSTNGTAFTTVLANRTKTTSGSVTLAIPAGPAATAKFVRISLNNRAPVFSRTATGILELGVTADIPVPPPPPPPPPDTNPGPGTGTDGGPVSGTFAFQTLFPSFVMYRPDTGRLRYETVGARTEAAQIALNNLAAEALAAAPTHRFRGRGRMVRASDGAVLGAADVFMTQPADEPGVIVETDAATDTTVEIIWPSVTDGVPGADAIVRVELGSAPPDLDQQLINVEFAIDKVDAAGNVVASWSGATPNVQVNGAGGGTVPPPVPGGITGNFAFGGMFGSVPQYRPGRGRLRFEAVGASTDPATISLTNLAGEALSATPSHRFRGRGAIFRANADGTNGATIGSADVFMVQPADEPGVIVEADAATGNVVEIIWPSIETGAPADAVVRVEVSNAPFGLEFSNINVEFTVDKVDANNTVVASWTGRVTNVQVPSPRL